MKFWEATEKLPVSRGTGLPGFAQCRHVVACLRSRSSCSNQSGIVSIHVGQAPHPMDASLHQAVKATGSVLQACAKRGTLIMQHTVA